MNGAGGLRRTSRFLTDGDAKRRAFERLEGRGCLRFVGDLELLPRDARPARPENAFSGSRSPASSAVMLQYSRGTNASISRSRSTISRTATDCTRPAERPPRTFAHSSGEIL